ncbi:hypothetical protein Leryth_020942 [Lithospermum erythrorhizon]|nr:hypothetical protein Leryth_020942 [Lithospermum erythrorhizon]
MSSSGRACLGGVEVPIIGSDSIKWFTVSLSPFNNTSALTASASQLTFTRDYAASSLIGNPTTYFIWRISASEPNVLKITELYGDKEFPRNGLRIVFRDALLPFAFICKNEAYTSPSSYMLYTMTISGVAYLVRLRDGLNYSSCSVIPSTEITEFNTETNHDVGAIVAVTATRGCLVIGRNDGTASAFRLGSLEPSSPGFASQLRDDGAFSRLWGIMSRNRMAAPVLDLVVSEIYQKKILIVLHSDGCLRVWDLLSQHRIFSHTLTNLSSQGTVYVKLFAGEANHDSDIITLAVSHKHVLDASESVISIYSLSFNFGDKIVCSLEPLSQCISLEAEPVDVRITANKVYILKEDGLVMQELLHEDINKELSFYYTLEEAYVAEQLFQYTEHSSDDLLWLANTVFSSSKDRIVPFLSSIFLRRLLLPGVHDKEALRQTLHHYNRHLRDSEISCLTVAGVKNEILSVIESEGGTVNPFLVLQSWKNFCMHYFENWCKNNAASGMLIDSSSGSVTLIRRSTVSLCRALEEVEVVNSGSFDEQNDILSSAVHLPRDDLDREILYEVLQCISYFSQYLDRAPSAIFYEALLSAPDSSEEVLSQLMKVLESGFRASVVTRHISEHGAGVLLEKEVSSHKNSRKFSMDIFVALHSLRSKAAKWDKVLDVIQIYLQFLVPCKYEHRLDSQATFSINSSATVQATSQVAKVMFDSALDVLILLSYMVKIRGQIYMSHADVSRIKLEFIPMIQELITEWHIIHFFGTTASESPAFQDFNLQLSSLKIDGNVNKNPWNEKLGKCEFTLAIILLVYSHSSDGLQSNQSSVLRHPLGIVDSVREFASWIIWGSTGKESPVFFGHSIDIALVLLRHGQYDAVEYLLTMVDAYSRKEKMSESLQTSNGAVWASLLHLLGCCFILKSQGELHVAQRERKVSEAVRCFFRVASVEGAPEALKSLSAESGWPTLDFAGYVSSASWKLHYYQWAMQLFEQYNMSEAACQFALAALEQVDEAACSTEDEAGAEAVLESAAIIRGRLWANVFKFTLDCDLYYDAYCAIISNPDEESKSVCLRRFIIVLYERGAMKFLCDGQLPFIGLTEKVEQELAWKAQRSDVSSKPNPYKILYAFEMHMHNWRRAANYIYQYTTRLKSELPLKDTNRRSLALQERLDGLSAAINALQLLHPAYAWIEIPVEDLSRAKNDFPSKRARMTPQDQTSENDSSSEKPMSYIDIEKLENEYVLASAEYLLSLANAKWNSTGNEKSPSDIVDLLVDSSIYDLAFTMILKFWKGSALKRALERIFAAMSLKCCVSRLGHSAERDNHPMHGFLLTASEDEVVFSSNDAGPTPMHPVGSNHWETLEHYLDQYKKYHPRLPVIVAETLLAADAQIELPLWLVQMFKGARRETSRGMSGNDSDPASLLRLYVDYGRYLEATTLILDYIESLASMRPVDVLQRKKPFSVWFPYATIERLWCGLEESIKLGHMVDQSEKLKKLLHGALLNHLNLVKVDSADVLSAQ